MVQVSVDEIGQDLSAYLLRVEAGETLVIVKAGKPMAELRPVASTSKPVRPLGLCTGEFVVPDDFDDPLPENIIRKFEGRSGLARPATRSTPCWVRAEEC
ncbi:MAG: type II toxin-antitoxin system prevent-host-death family antitoxin [Anaerolineae bacterium]|nr:type II toxin-antitoxin system prevent-host-death family antitoxin [Anaerolineae bacterium]